MPSKEIESPLRGDNYFSMYNLGRRGAQRVKLLHDTAAYAVFPNHLRCPANPH
jgi:hypothetical protein